MRTLARQLSTYLFRRNPGNERTTKFSFFNNRDDRSIEEEAERKIGWLLKMIFVGSVSTIGYHFFPYMGENVMQQSVSLLRVKDPLFKRMGASRLARFAIDDEKRKKILDLGGAEALINMLEVAKDDRTRKEALKALSALSQSDEVAFSLCQAGANSVIKSTTDSSDDTELMSYKTNLLKKFRDLKCDSSS
ncbi:hypothetical protein AQUCO_00500184v1 [Aquilegia coerulea]|uniref:Armadillo repeat-containing domain-containing protein n=1 Tax=Aquilegia coerulea TaxID=218851 RepID=A0A2G5EQR8_AQUCA|nr:hypothetical protein AQUCO_00500184v1 [Aquilegia coerulea]